MIREIKFGKNTARYDGNVEPHHHIVCLKCGNLEDVMCAVHPDMLWDVEKAKSYKITGYQIEFQGICTACQEQSRRARIA